MHAPWWVDDRDSNYRLVRLVWLAIGAFWTLVVIGIWHVVS